MTSVIPDNNSDPTVMSVAAMETSVNIFTLFCFLQLWFVSLASENPEVTLSTGRVQGQKLVSAANRTYYSFLGIPYAQPPIGYLRFKAPRPPKSWNGTLEAFHIPPACSQPWRVVEFPERYSEDCLYVNVFTPYLKPPQDKPMPVMVWIHGGKDYQGSGTPYKYGPDFLVTADVIVVTFNYRLGIFGYLNTNSKSAQGNAAAKDKVALLRWVQKEISHFGGDPKSVTIFGGSSGGQDVNCLYISPMAKGLFHRAISQSSAYCGMTYHITAEGSYLENVNPGLRLAERLGCSSSDPEEAVAFLRNITAQVLAERQQDVFIQGLRDSTNPFLVSVEEDHGEEIFMSKPPEEALKTSQSTVPYILGFNNAEGKMDVVQPEVNPTQFIEFEKHIASYLPKNILENFSKTEIDKIASKVKKFYFDDNPVSLENVEEYVNFMTDRKFGYFTVKTAKLLSGNAPVYLYYFVFEGKFKTPHNGSVDSFVPGASHADELGYLFYRNLIIHEQNDMIRYPRECTTLSRMVRLWTNFAKYGQTCTQTRFFREFYRASPNVSLKGPCRRMMGWRDMMGSAKAEYSPAFSNCSKIMEEVIFIPVLLKSGRDTTLVIA
ncbi:hypothetical protein J6590_031988 [Homalodisca vitripennis]|nr:hypothetical protein J6590_031988 [Homalodisca vitripennis]